MSSPIDIEELAKGAAFFPPVREVCTGCKGCGTIEIPHGTVMCPNCIPSSIEDLATGFTLREMDAREEHFYLMLLYQNLVTRLNSNAVDVDEL